MIDLTQIVNCILALIGAIITGIIVPWIKSKTTENQRKELLAWLEIAVQAAEQIYNGTGLGTQKKEYVIHFLQEHGYDVDSEMIEAMIESTVFDMKKAVSE